MFSRASCSKASSLINDRGFWNCNFVMRIYKTHCIRCCTVVY